MLLALGGFAGAGLVGEYAFTLTRDLLDELASGRYRFSVRAVGPGRGARIVRSSPSFGLR
ncbi:MAG: hypothetical protein H0V85_00450 [Thermoleophilaceae bacterium]|nr:hypothetical protein [Thermoleophilaceae bacterium]